MRSTQSWPKSPVSVSGVGVQPGIGAASGPVSQPSIIDPLSSAALELLALAFDALIDASPAPLSELLEAPPPGSSPQPVKIPQSRSAKKPRFIASKHTTV